MEKSYEKRKEIAEKSKSTEFCEDCGLLIIAVNERVALNRLYAHTAFCPKERQYE